MEVFNKLLCGFQSKYISVEHRDKPMKQGVLVGWKCHPLFFELLIKTKKGEEKLKLFYPFDFEEYDEGDLVSRELYLDYRIITFSNNIGIPVDEAEVGKFSHHKFLNTIVSIIQKTPKE